jgi:N-acetylmuramoyl-L-alanine amidase
MAMPMVSPAIAAEDMKAAESCRDRLKAVPERKKTRENWEECIQKYKETRAFKQNDGRALLETARLYQELYLYSNRKEDLRIAKEHYQKIADRSSQSPPGKEAQRQINRIETLLGEPPPPPADVTILSNIRHWAYPDYTRVVIDLNRPASFKVDQSSSTSLTIRLSDAVLGDLFKKNRSISVRDSPLKQIEAKQKEQNTVDVVLTFKQMGAHKVIPLSDPDRVVIDVSNSKQESMTARPKEEAAQPDLTALLPPPPSFAIRTIVIDPGHGGKDPGAIGVNGLEEKEVVLDVSLRLRNLIEKKLKKKVIMTREEDVFIPLDERTLLANAKKADLFISVHANSSPKRNTQGVEIYFLGRATDERAIEVAARENATSEKAARDFQEVILNDLERDFNINESLEFAHLTENAFVEQLISKYPTTSLGVKRAPFYVLANTNMPAILAEISFLTHPTEAKRLRSSQYRQKIAEALFKGIERYLDSTKSDS